MNTYHNGDRRHTKWPRELVYVRKFTGTVAPCDRPGFCDAAAISDSVIKIGIMLTNNIDH